ncbi:MULTISPECIES: SAM-dependent methyltransferase [Nonlabens]|uniref:16S rRNA (Cytidine1402-2'-O)-methyltransferase n=1 Tax=Nonlabens ulvanivorans TaxID=906888 RepID=A0A081DGJ9_NONUL|nr:SAM-dependent methyltransferase [Nonlabens ulvanivorans]KEZ94657.1 SAM-dependent methyltransferase [Nonlabens ulvanivorans]PRX12085.1 16S rRNA (cytidine1402-2'-O)-methyltransferase [Nonlabens ulvanivorans]WOI23666.1 SAM-dependent methyltransferase [Nonlabens ulvanivorans]GAK78045.1 tetrapyrrole (Corrin-porphyrin) methylasefamily protein [Nonlabens ulvanivorans]GAL02045.1 tetrapyrrole (corrin-porphyrin) methylase family protein [Nonlabens ulvanivorans]
MDHKGKLYLIPVTLGDINPFEVLPLSIKKVVENINHYVVENEKTARRFIKSVVPSKPQPELVLFSINKYTDPSEIPSFLEPCLQGHDMGVMSEAGVPGVADPGADVIKIAHQKGIQVVPLVGPSSILMAVMASGLNGQNFAFCGYLPIDNMERRKRIKELESRSFNEQQSQLFIETPYRNNKMMEELLLQLHPSTEVCIACDITLPTEFIKTMSVNLWKKQVPDLHKRPTIFMIHKKN